MPQSIDWEKRRLATKEGLSIHVKYFHQLFCRTVNSENMWAKKNLLHDTGTYQAFDILYIYHPYGNHKCTLFACQTGPPYSPFAGGRHQSALGPPSIFCFQAFCLY